MKSINITLFAQILPYLFDFLKFVVLFIHPESFLFSTYLYCFWMFSVCMFKGLFKNYTHFTVQMTEFAIHLVPEVYVKKHIHLFIQQMSGAYVQGII